MIRSLLLVALAGAAAATVAGPAGAHQTAVNNGVSVTVHVNPNDEPVVGEETTIWVVRVKALRAAFTWRTCRCRLKVFDSSGKTLLDGPVSVARTPVTFPEEKAYGITFSGRVNRRGGGMKPFRVTFAVRASDGS